MKSGYCEIFIEGCRVNMPVVKRNHSVIKDYLKLDYMHFSILFSKERKQPICTAVNINGKDFIRIKRKTDRWLPDNLLNKQDQLVNNFYKVTNKDFHKGHIVRRTDPCWGNLSDAKIAEKDTFHFTNASPQHRMFNPQIWLELERNILEKGAVTYDEKIIVFAGPVLSPSDKPFIKKIDGEFIFIPSRFWKIIIWKKQNNNLYAVGFMQSQEILIDRWIDHSYGKDRVKRTLDEHFENLKFKNNIVYQVDIHEISNVTGLVFDFENIILPRVSKRKKELTITTEQAFSYKGAYRSTSFERLNIGGLVLE